MTSRNRLILILAVGMIAVGGCATPKKNVNPLQDLQNKVKELEKDKGYCYSAVLTLRRDLAYKNERLKAFNQLDKEGRLREETDCFKNPDNCGQGVSGKESWQK